MQKILYFVVVIIVLGLGYWYWQSQQAPAGPNEAQSDVIIDSVQSGAQIKSPLTVKGRARGTWFFEASFPFKVVDANGVVLGEELATANSDWMTINLVPFTGTIVFDEPTTATGFLVFNKDNPSGLPEHDAEFRVPVTFAPANDGETTNVKVYFQNEDAMKAGKDICTTVIAVNRTITSVPTVGHAALEELLKGPSATETAAGYTTSIPAGVKVNNLTIVNGVAKADFSAALDNKVSGSCRVTAIRKQITETLQQFPTVKSVVISVNGETETILQP